MSWVNSSDSSRSLLRPRAVGEPGHECGDEAVALQFDGAYVGGQRERCHREGDDMHARPTPCGAPVRGARADVADDHPEGRTLHQALDCTRLGFDFQARAGDGGDEEEVHERRGDAVVETALHVEHPADALGHSLILDDGSAERGVGRRDGGTDDGAHPPRQ